MLGFGALGQFALGQGAGNAYVSATATITLPTFGQAATLAALVQATASTDLPPFGVTAEGLTTRRELTATTTFPAFTQMFAAVRKVRYTSDNAFDDTSVITTTNTAPSSIVGIRAATINITTGSFPA